MLPSFSLSLSLSLSLLLHTPNRLNEPPGGCRGMETTVLAISVCVRACGKKYISSAVFVCCRSQDGASLRHSVPSLFPSVFLFAVAFSRFFINAYSSLLSLFTALCACINYIPCFSSNIHISPPYKSQRAYGRYSGIFING